MRDPHLHFIEINSVELAYFEFLGDGPGEQTLVFIHGAGCHARSWDAVIDHLGPTCRVIAIELRGHGRSQKQGPYSWQQFGLDTCGLIEALGLTSIVCVGHSLGGHVAIQAAARLRECFAALVLVDPTVFDPRAYGLGKRGLLFDSPSEHPVARRRRLWNSPAQWYEVLRSRSPHKLWDPDILWTHCQYGLQPTEAGLYELCCPPLVEAETYLSTADTDVHPLLPSIQTPVHILRAKMAKGMRHPMDSEHSLTWPHLVDGFPNARDQYLPEVSHYIPMQRPDLIADAVRECLA